MTDRTRSTARPRRTARPAGSARRRTAREYSSPACYLHELESGEGGAGEVRIKRIYEAPEGADGYRVLVDRLWPRGISRRRAALDAWLVEIAPSTQLRLWFGHDPKRWSEFRRRYRGELRAQRQALDSLRERARTQRLTLLYGSRETRINHAAVLREVLLKTGASRRRSSAP